MTKTDKKLTENDQILDPKLEKQIVIFLVFFELKIKKIVIFHCFFSPGSSGTRTPSE